MMITMSSRPHGAFSSLVRGLTEWLYMMGLLLASFSPNWILVLMEFLPFLIGPFALFGMRMAPRPFLARRCVVKRPRMYVVQL